MRSKLSFPSLPSATENIKLLLPKIKSQDCSHHISCRYSVHTDMVRLVLEHKNIINGSFLKQCISILKPLPLWFPCWTRPPQNKTSSFHLHERPRSHPFPRADLSPQYYHSPLIISPFWHMPLSSCVNVV